MAAPAGVFDVFGGLEAAAYLVDDQGVIVRVTARAEALFGRPAAGLVGQDAHALLHRNDDGRTMPRAQCPMMRAFLGRVVEHEEQGWFERSDGELLRLWWLVVPCALPEGGRGALVVFGESAPVDAPWAPAAAPTAGDLSAAADSSASTAAESASPSGASGAASEPSGASPAASSSGALTELGRLALLAETTTRLTSTLDTDEALKRLVTLLVPRLADWVVIDLLTEVGDVRRTAVVHYEDGGLVHREDLEGTLPPVPQESSMPLSRALRGAASALAGPDTYNVAADSGIAVEQQRLFKATGIHSAAIAPVRTLREVLGALTLGRSERTEPFTPADLSLLEDITRRAGLALDNARLYQRQRRVAETMQRHLLPHLPAVPGLRMAARYQPAPHASQVGGDWYDAFSLTDGATALVIGDVGGHDLDAAAGMAQLRNMLRAFTWSQSGPLSHAVQRLDEALEHIAEASTATLVLGSVERDEEGGWLLRWTSAGHPPPLLVAQDGSARFLTPGGGIMLGTRTRLPRADHVEVLPPRSTLLLYTDGLIESRSHTLDDGLDRLRREAAALAGQPLDPFCDTLLDRVRPADNDDDVAILALRIPEDDPGPA
ncbi:SpoIIE family protein phosphatase [Streptomyces sp. NPDC008121]|uniref:SpoIIE family protein phosphatase n=1 Tax=Streptomyces sp. NPDC008121 TaxID=3364809 RepID=UPI0036EBCA3C